MFYYAASDIFLTEVYLSFCKIKCTVFDTQILNKFVQICFICGCAMEKNTKISIQRGKKSKKILLFKSLRYFLWCSENREPLLKIFGPSFAVHLEKEAARPDLPSPGDQVEEDNTATDSNAKLNLFALIQRADEQILCKIVEETTKWVPRPYLFLFHQNTIQSLLLSS